LAARQHSRVDENGQVRISAVDLERSALEIGISPEALRIAKAEHAKQRENGLLRQQFIRLKRERLFGHVVQYVFVNFVLAFTSLSNGQYWFLLPVFGWGIAIVIHAFRVYRTSGPGFETAFLKWRDALIARPTDPRFDEMLRKYCDDLDKSGVFAIKRVEMIVWFREKTGLSLEDSVEVVDGFARRNPGYVLT
jgi:hypothetical protein